MKRELLKIIKESALKEKKNSDMLG